MRAVAPFGVFGFWSFVVKEQTLYCALYAQLYICFQKQTRKIITKLDWLLQHFHRANANARKPSATVVNGTVTDEAAPVKDATELALVVLTPSLLVEVP